MPNTKTIQNYDEIFTNDKLNIKSNVIDFAHLIEQDGYKEGSTSKVYSISAEFGIGKTFFCDKLQQVLAQDEVNVGKLNIWEMDFYENPLVPILAELNKLYTKEGESIPAKIVNIVMNLGKKAIDVISEVSAKVGYNCAIAQLSQMPGCENLITTADEANLWEVCKEKISSTTIYDDYNEYQNALNSLKDCLSQWASKQKDKPIVIIIDELDRCKPDYAVKTLEVLKHIFDIPGFVFVLAIDEEQLKNSVQTLFGTINYEGYKRKFISNSFQLPEPNKLAFTEYLYEKSGINDYIEQIQKDKRELIFYINTYNVFRCSESYSEYGNYVKETEAKKFNQNENSKSIIQRYYTAYSECFGFTLRQMDQIFERLTLFVKQISASKEILSPDLAVYLICLHEFDIKIYNKVISQHGNVITACPKSKNLFSFIMENCQDERKNKLKQFNRSIAPELLPINGYSDHRPKDFIGNIRQEPIIKDNIDRFFIENTERLVNKAIDSGEIQLENINLKTLKESYCKHIDFIAHFD